MGGSYQYPNGIRPLTTAMNAQEILRFVVSILLFIGAVYLANRAIRWAKKGSKAGSLLAAAAFPFPEQPSPQEQVEQENRIKKAAESGDPAS